MLDVLVVEEAAHGRLDLVLLAVTAGRTGVGNDGTAARNDRGVLHEAAVGVLLQRGQDGHVHAALLERVLVIVVLLDGALVDGLSQLGGAGDAVAEGLTGTANYDVAELGHGNPPWFDDRGLPAREARFPHR